MPNASLTIDGTEVIKKENGIASIENIKIGSSVDTVSNASAGYKPAEVWLSTTEITAQDTIIDLPDGYKKYHVIGHNLFWGGTATSGDIRMYMRYNNNTQDDTGLQMSNFYLRLDTNGFNQEVYDGFVNISNNMGTDPTENCFFDIWLNGCNEPNKTRGYTGHGMSTYGHASDQQAYHYTIGFRSQLTDAIDGFRIYFYPDNNAITSYGGSIVVTGYTF